MSRFDEHAEQLYDAVRAGEATPAQRAEFDRRLREDDAFRAEVEHQQRIDAALGRWAEPPARSVPAHSVSSRRWWPLALAATLAIIGSAGFFAWRAGVFGGGSGGGAGGGGGTISPYARLTASQIYEDAASGNFTPAWRCESDEEFIKAVRDRTGRAALLPMATPGVEIVGWSYSDTSRPAVSIASMWLYVRTDDGPAVVIVDRLDRDERAGGLARGGSDRYRAFRREINGLVLYEITPADEPSVLEHFVAPGGE